MHITNRFFFLIIISCSLLFQYCSSDVINYKQEVIREDSLTVSGKAAKIKSDIPLTTAPDMVVKLWATDRLAPDPIAMSIDDYGRVYLTRTNRQKNSEFDIRGHRDWMAESIGLQSVADRRAFLRKEFATERSAENEWLKDLNGDGAHDWKDLAVEKDEVWRIEDTNKDNVADVSTRIIRDFNEEITDVAGALLVRRDDIFVGVGPDMWRITDSNNDGLLDTKVSISHGYAVHVGFSGHGMSGVVEGPDGKIYWGIGDIGSVLTDQEGNTYNYPNQGVLVRSNPDGSDFEVFAAGLRNVHEFTFDEYGNIIGADNDGDHRGEKERVLYIVEGHDAGWRSNWQYGKYTDPKNNSYKVWMDEQLHLPRWEGQAAYILPPLFNFHSGPTGMVYNPGTALSSKWKNKFFLVEFTGNPTRSPIWAFDLKPDGASFAFNSEEKVLEGILPTGIRFGPDGALYAADWINGWGTKNYGRVWRLDVKVSENDLIPERIRTRELMKADYQAMTSGELYDLLFYGDMRIRQKAQFALVDQGKGAFEIFKSVITQKENQLARIHGIWGTGQLIRSGLVSAEVLMPVLDDSDPEIVAQVAKVLGEVRYDKAGTRCISLLAAENDRVKFFAAQALGRIGHDESIEALIALIKNNADKDLYLRHAAVVALSRMESGNDMIALATSPDKPLKTAAVMVLRRQKDPEIAVFLKDSDEYIVTEAARAINDDFSIEEALPDLAALLSDTRFSGEPLIRRAINAASRVGGDAQIDLLIDFTNRLDVDAELIAEALDVLGTWSQPSVLDRVDGRYRGNVTRDDAYIITKLKLQLGSLLQSDNPMILQSAANAISRLNLSEFSEELVLLATNHPDANVRGQMILVLDQLEYENMVEVVKKGLNDPNGYVRTRAIRLISRITLEKNDLAAIVSPIVEKGTLEEQQQLVKVIGSLPIAETQTVMESLIDKWIDGQLHPGISLDLLTAVDSTYSPDLIALIEPYRPKGNTTADFEDVLYGGDERNGGSIFFNNTTAQCIRCHSWQKDPNSVGPYLRNIGNQLTRRQLLQAMIEPGAWLAPGYGTVSLILKDGTRVSGTLMEENGSELILKTGEAEPLEVPLQRIAERTNFPSSMPAMGTILTRSEIRDLVEFLSNLKED